MSPGAWNPEENDLGYTVLQLRNDVDDLAAAIDDLPARFRSVGSVLDDVRAGLVRVEARTTEVDTGYRELTALVKRLGARVEWLERNIRLTTTTAEIEIDDVDEPEAQLARVAEQGSQARAGLLPPAGRSSLEAAVTAHADAVRAHDHQRALALEACEVLAGTRWDDEEHRSAVTAFRTAVASMDEARSAVLATADAASDASAQLASDSARQLAVADVIADGELAWAALQDRLRMRVADAVGSGGLLPTWFTGVLGPIPPAEDTGPWMDVATSLLAYRVTYDVNDPIVALGPEPGEGETARRRAWHRQLRRQLAELQR
jgi:hypothetical protein